MDKACVFIDGANLYATARMLQFDMDYKRLREFLTSYNVLRYSYYTAVRVCGPSEFDALKPMLDYLQYNGYRLVSKPMKEYTNELGKVHRKGNMDIEICVDMMEAAAYCDTIILVSGDGDFTYVVNALQRLGKYVIVVSTVSTTPSMCSDELRRQCDIFIDLAYHVQHLRKQGKPKLASGLEQEVDVMDEASAVVTD